jgi:succinate dehydrogenase / fumarate reductase membrane anchor subunit
MVMVAKSNHRGFYEWIVQRVSAVLIGAYGVFIFAFLLCHQPMQYAVWHGLFSHLVMKIATFVVLLAILWHAWIGLWTVFTDYVKCGVLRLFLEILLVLVLLSYFAWCLDTLLR